jgi:hypothetical protein
MDFIRGLYWCGILGWSVVTVNFVAGWLVRRSLLRFTWAMASASGVLLLVTRVTPVPPWLRTLLDVAMAIAGSTCGAGLVVRYVQNPRVIQ